MRADKCYDPSQTTAADTVLEQAAEIIKSKYLRGDVFTSSQATSDYLRYKLGGYDREVFAVLLLDSQHRLIEFKELFWGTIDATSIYPREVVKLALNYNAAAVIFAHNHPSGNPEPSNADKLITQKLKSALELIDVSVLDHFVVGETCVSFAEKGFI